MLETRTLNQCFPLLAVKGTRTLVCTQHRLQANASNAKHPRQATKMSAIAPGPHTKPSCSSQCGDHNLHPFRCKTCSTLASRVSKSKHIMYPAWPCSLKACLPLPWLQHAVTQPAWLPLQLQFYLHILCSGCMASLSGPHLTHSHRMPPFPPSRSDDLPGMQLCMHCHPL